jgi:methionyl-tRNA synthetase
MAKSLNNVIDPEEILKKYETDPIRYYLLKEIPTQSDGDFTKERFKEVYNADLANTLGNLVSRVTTLCEADGLEGVKNYKDAQKKLKISIDQNGYFKHLEKFEFNLALEKLWRELRKIDKKIAEEKPWEKTAKERKENLKSYAEKLLSIAYELQVFLPTTADKILKALQEKKIKKIKSLFPRLE